MDQIGNKLWIGNSRDAQDEERQLEHDITAVLNVAFDLDYAPSKRVVYCKVPLIDGPGNNPRQFDYAIVMLLTLLQLGHTVLVHCHEGRSRSATVAATVIALRLGLPNIQEAYDRISKARDIAPKQALIDLGRNYLASAGEP